MSNFSESKDLYSTIFTVLKSLGVKVPKIKNFKSSLPEQDKSTQQSDTQMFGVSLFKQEWTYESGYALPKFLALSTAYLEKFSRTLGLFRKSGSIARQRNLRNKFRNGESLEGSDPNDVASLLKQWLRELPEPLIPCCLHDLFVRCQHLDSEDCVTATLLSCLLLPPEHLHSLKHLLCFLKDIASYKSDNKMRKRNLAIIMAPNIFASKIESVKTCNSLVELHTSVIKLLIKNADRVGEVPQSVLLHYPDFGEKRVSEQSSADSGPSKSSRKFRTKPIKGLFSGIRKLVGQNTTTPINLKTSTPKTTWTSSNISCRQKSNSTSCQMKRNLAISRSSSFNSNIPVDKMNSAFKVTTSSNDTERKSSAVQFEYDELNYENVVMRSSECNLAINSKESFNLFTPTSSYCPQGDSYGTVCWSPSSTNNKTEQSETLQSKCLYENIEYLRKSKTINKSEGLAIKPDHFDMLKMLSPIHNLINSSSYDPRCNSNNCVDLHQSKYFSAGSKWKDEGKGASNLNSKVANKTARKSSLRGKPNTAGSGLLCQPLNKNPIPLQSLEINNNKKIVNDRVMNPISVKINPKTNVSEKDNEVLFSEQDFSLIFNFPNFNLPSFSADDTPERNERSSVISVPKKSLPSNENESYAITLSNGPSNLKNLSDHSYSETPRLTHSLGTHPKYSSEISIDCRIKPPKIRLSSSEISPGIPMLSKTQLQLSDLEASLNDSCFLTPNDKPMRKSIAEMLKKSGYVSEKVQIYESKSCLTPSANDNRRVPLLEKNPLRSFSQKRLFSTESNHKTLSVSQSCDASISKRTSNNERMSNRICTPLKVPHSSYKCSINLGMTSSHTSHSLKKVKNTNFDGKQTTSDDNNPVQDDNNSQNPIASSQRKSYNTDSNRMKLRRNTFSSRNPPSKFAKRVFRSESSPSCLRPTDRLFKLIQESTLSNPNVPLEMNNVLNSSFSSTYSFPYQHLKKSGSSISIQKLRSNEMIDEWQCEL